jgi:hypothetical protein
VCVGGVVLEWVLKLCVASLRVGPSSSRPSLALLSLLNTDARVVVAPSSQPTAGPWRVWGDARAATARGSVPSSARRRTGRSTASGARKTTSRTRWRRSSPSSPSGCESTARWRSSRMVRVLYPSPLRLHDSCRGREAARHACSHPRLLPGGVWRRDTRKRYIHPAHTLGRGGLSWCFSAVGIPWQALGSNSSYICHLRSGVCAGV